MRRAVPEPQSSGSTTKRGSSSSASSAADSSRVWNGFSGVSRPGEKVIRFGVVISSVPAGRSTRSAFGEEADLVPQVLDDLEVGHHVDGSSASGNRWRSPRTTAICG